MQINSRFSRTPFSFFLKIESILGTNLQSIFWKIDGLFIGNFYGNGGQYL